MKILVLEDEPSLREAIKAKLESEGFSVVTTKSVDEALTSLKKETDISAVWLDHYLFGDKSGLDFVTTVRKHKTWKRLPLFVVSNTASPDKRQAYLKLGVEGFYSKVDHSLTQIVTDITQVLTAKPKRTEHGSA